MPIDTTCFLFVDRSINSSRAPLFSCSMSGAFEFEDLALNGVTSKFCAAVSVMMSGNVLMVMPTLLDWSIEFSVFKLSSDFRLENVLVVASSSSLSTIGCENF